MRNHAKNQYKQYHGEVSFFEKQWAPHIIGELNGQYAKLCKLKDEFVWHSHEANGY